MLINIPDPTSQTIIFAVIFVGLLLVSVKRAKNEAFFSKEVTNQLKGLAILAVIFSHIGYFLAFPLGICFALTQNIFLRLTKMPKLLIKAVLVLSAAIFVYTAINSAVGQGFKLEQSTSLITALSAVIIFTLSKFDFRLLTLFGIYSYEVYLLHWPILSRYNAFLGLPPFLMVIINLVLVIILSYILQKVLRGAEKLFSFTSKQGINNIVR